MNEALQVQPIGAVGELCIGGAGVARGYWAREELTNERFVGHPFVPGERMYRTGDLARWLPDGRLEHMGRMDHQVKIRGYRIELGEVEAHLLQIEGVKEAVVTVIAGERETDAAELCAYVTVTGSSELGAKEMRSKLAEGLPSYMLPTHIISLPEMPLTPNGKLDRKALPKPEVGGQSEVAYVAPRTPVEAEVARLWEEVLGLERVGIRDNFFALGGHSLRAMTLVSRMHQALETEVPLREVFLYPTVEELAAVISVREQKAYAAIPRVEARDYYPLSSAQKRMYILQQLEEAGKSYNMPGMLLLEGELNRARFEAAFGLLIARHETLRTAFELVQGEPMQRVKEAVDFEVAYVGVASKEEVEARVRDFVQPFDLSEAPLLRVELIEWAEERYVLLLDMHHIISDGASMDILVEEFARLYREEKLPELRIQYKDYAVWQQSEANKEQMKEHEAYWLKALAGELPVLELPTDAARPAVRQSDGAAFDFELDSHQRDALHELAAQHGSTLYMVLLAAYTILLHKYSGQEDIIVGTPIASRTHPDIEPLIGMFVNTLAIRTYPHGSMPFLSYLQEMKETALGAYEHQDYLFEQLVENVQVNRDLSRNPVFDAMFVLQNTENTGIRMEGLELKPYQSEYTIAKFDLVLDVREESNGLSCNLQYATALFNRETAQRMAKHFAHLVDSIIEAPEAEIADLSMLSSKELAQILHGFNDTTAEYQREKTIQQLFEEQAQQNPNAVAVRFEQEQLTYRALNERANRLARTLRAAGVKPDIWWALWPSARWKWPLA